MEQQNGQGGQVGQDAQYQSEAPVLDADSRHMARAVAWHWDTSKRGAMCLGMKLRLTEGAFAGVELTGTLYFDTDMVSEKDGKCSADRSLETLKAMGMTSLDAIDTDVGGLEKGDVQVTVGYGETGYPFAKFINIPRKFEPFAPPSPDAKRSFIMEMRQRMAQQSGTAPPAAAPAARQAAPAAQRPPAAQQRQAAPAARQAQPRQAPAPRNVAQPQHEGGGTGGDDDIPF